MKQIAAAVSRLRRGGNGNKAKEMTTTQNDDGIDNDNNPYVSRINIIHHGHRGGDNDAGATVSTLTNNDHIMSNRRKFGMDMDYDKAEEEKASGNRRDGGDNKELKDEASSVWSGVVGVDYHLSRREQIWYKDQMYLLAKQKNEAAASCTPTRISHRYESSDRRDRYSPDFNKHKDSPRGVHEFESEISMYKNGKSCEPGSNKKEVRFCRSSNNRRSGRRLSRQISSQTDDDTWTRQSSSLFDGDDTCTNQSSTVFDDDTRTNQSSSSFNEEDTQFDEVTLEETTDEGESLFTSLDDATTSPSYIFQLIDDGGFKQRQKYQLGVGQNPNSRSTLASPPARRRRVTVHAPRGRRGKNSTDDANFVDGDIACPVLPEMLEEVHGTYKDFKKSLDQVMHAFFISEDDVDRMSDKIRDAKLELVDLIKKKERCGRSILL